MKSCESCAVCTHARLLRLLDNKRQFRVEPLEGGTECCGDGSSNWAVPGWVVVEAAGLHSAEGAIYVVVWRVRRTDVRDCLVQINVRDVVVCCGWVDVQGVQRRRQVGKPHVSTHVST